jgi:hypothetical protein
MANINNNVNHFIDNSLLDNILEASKSYWHITAEMEKTYYGPSQCITLFQMMEEMKLLPKELEINSLSTFINALEKYPTNQYIDRIIDESDLSSMNFHTPCFHTIMERSKKGIHNGNVMNNYIISFDNMGLFLAICLKSKIYNSYYIYNIVEKIIMETKMIPSCKESIVDVLHINSDKFEISDYKHTEVKHWIIHNVLSIHLFIQLIESSKIEYCPENIDYRVGLWHPYSSTLSDLISLREYQNIDNAITKKIKTLQNVIVATLDQTAYNINIESARYYIVTFRCLCGSDENLHSTVQIERLRIISHPCRCFKGLHQFFKVNNDDNKESFDVNIRRLIKISEQDVIHLKQIINGEI